MKLGNASGGKGAKLLIKDLQAFVLPLPVSWNKALQCLLCEMVVPVIEYHYLRNDSMKYKRNKQKYDTKPVTVNLLSANRKISNMIFSLNFYQKDAVGANREAATYQVYFTDENNQFTMSFLFCVVLFYRVFFPSFFLYQSS